MKLWNVSSRRPTKTTLTEPLKNNPSKSQTEVIRSEIFVENWLKVGQLLENRDCMEIGATDGYGRNLLHIAVLKHGPHEIISKLLKNQFINKNQKDTCFGRTPLLTAIMNKAAIDIIELMLQNDCEPDIPDKFGRTCLFQEAQLGANKEKMELLLRYNSNIHVRSHSFQVHGKRNVLELVIDLRHYTCIPLLLSYGAIITPSIIAKEIDKQVTPQRVISYLERMRGISRVHSMILAVTKALIGIRRIPKDIINEVIYMLVLIPSKMVLN